MSFAAELGAVAFAEQSKITSKPNRRSAAATYVAVCDNGIRTRAYRAHRQIIL
jgi:hypothetical protein